MVTRPTTGVLESGPDGHFAQDLDNTTGLTFAVYGGFYVARTVVNEIPDSTRTVTDNATVIVYLDLENMILSFGVTLPAADSIHLFTLTTLNGAITNVVDKRHRQFATNDTAKI